MVHFGCIPDGQPPGRQSRRNGQLQPQQALVARNQCLPDKLKPHDIARMVLFLAADDGAMCTAQEFKVDAGWV